MSEITGSANDVVCLHHRHIDVDSRNMSAYMIGAKLAGEAPPDIETDMSAGYSVDEIVKHIIFRLAAQRVGTMDWDGRHMANLPYVYTYVASTWARLHK